MTERVPTSTLGQVFAQLRTASATGNPADCIEVMSGKTQQVVGLRSESIFSGHNLVIDEPISFGGTGTAPNPAEVLLAAIGASIEVTARVYAEYMGIDVTSIGVDLSAKLNSQGFFGTKEGIRSGFHHISAKVNIVSNDKPETIAELLEIVQRCCPVLDNVRAPTEVMVTIDHRTPGSEAS
ncbi:MULTISPECIES: OsmC family protein [unclassified Mesorhizobium]|uniref:OsmC family protein n=1 Tax=unclassified Mesorhizobium TaxID=325217 RepID=UPI003334B203